MAETVAIALTRDAVVSTPVEIAANTEIHIRLIGEFPDSYGSGHVVDVDNGGGYGRVGSLSATSPSLKYRTPVNTPSQLRISKNPTTEEVGIGFST